MVGLSNDLSDTDDSSSAIEEIISQAKDSILLQQISAINCSSFTNSLLPTDLESRFQKLKSFPVNHTPPSPYYHPTPNSSLPPNPTNTNPQSFNLSPPKSNPNKNPDSGSLSSPSEKKLKVKPIPKPKQGSRSLSPSASSSSRTSEESSLFMPTKTGKEKLSKQKSLWGCFWRSPKEEKKKSSRENVLGWDFDASDDFLSGLGSLSMKEQQKVIKKAMKEEEKISREAEKIVEWAKHVSARINISDIEDELSDN